MCENFYTHLIWKINVKKMFTALKFETILEHRFEMSLAILNMSRTYFV